MSETDESNSRVHSQAPMIVAELMALLEGHDWRSEVRLAFVIDDCGRQSPPIGLTGFTVAVVTSPVPPPQPGTVWIIAARDSAPFPIEAWTPTNYRRP